VTPTYFVIHVWLCHPIRHYQGTRHAQGRCKITSNKPATLKLDKPHTDLMCPHIIIMSILRVSDAIASRHLFVLLKDRLV
jgi:hypothetical protein